jgi:folate-dependent phosphoribosylglycinamide formyltransferase PurN
MRTHRPATQPLRVAVLCSHRAPALRYLVDHAAPRGPLYEIACCISSEAACADEDAIRACGIPIHLHPIRLFCEQHGTLRTDRGARSSYDIVTAQLLWPYGVDIVVLDTYLYVLSEVMLALYPSRVVNLHHSDLAQIDAFGRPRFPGLRAVRDAVLAGERTTRATVHLVTHGVDEGPPFLRSWPFPVAPLVEQACRWGANDILTAYTYAHQEWMIRSAWGPLMAGTLALVANGCVDLSTLSRSDPIWELDESGKLAYPATASTWTPPRSAVSYSPPRVEA